MTNPAQLKRNVKEMVLMALDRDGLAKTEILKASVRLETGFKKVVVDEIFNDMVKVGMIVINGDTIKRPEANG